MFALLSIIVYKCFKKLLKYITISKYVAIHTSRTPSITFKYIYLNSYSPNEMI